MSPTATLRSASCLSMAPMLLVKTVRARLSRFIHSTSPRMSSSAPASASGPLPLFNPSPAFRKSESPDARWTLGAGLRETSALARQWKADEARGWKTLNLDEMDKPDVYKMLTSAVTPRPIAFVSTLSTDGVPNLAPFSYFSLVSHNPPLLSVSFTLPARRPKDTRENIKATREFVVNIISEPFVDAANSTSIEAPADIDEWAVSELTPEPSDVVKPPRVRESAVSFECELFHFLDIAPPGSSAVTGSMALGLVRRAHVRAAVLAPDGLQVDAARLRAVARLGGSTFARVGEGFDIVRPSWRAFESDVRGLMAKKKEDEEEGK